MVSLAFSWKFYLGASLIIFSFIIGMITHFTIILYFNQSTIRWISIIAYVLSWPMLIIGAWLAGKEYVESIKKYFSYRYYSKNVRKGTSRAYRAAKNKTKTLEAKARVNAVILKNHTRNKTRQIKEQIKARRIQKMAKLVKK